MLSATISLLKDRPVEDISMDEIAHAAGVGKATLYRYFATKEVLLRACLEEVVDVLGRRMEDADATDASPPDRLHAIVVAMVETFSGHLLPLKLLTRRQSDLHDAWRQSVQSCRRRLVDVLKRHFDQGQAIGVYRDVDTELVPHLVMGMIRSSVTHVTERSDPEIADAICTFVLRACLETDGRQSAAGA